MHLWPCKSFWCLVGTQMTFVRCRRLALGPSKQDTPLPCTYSFQVWALLTVNLVDEAKIQPQKDSQSQSSPISNKMPTTLPVWRTHLPLFWCCCRTKVQGSWRGYMRHTLMCNNLSLYKVIAQKHVVIDFSVCLALCLTTVTLNKFFFFLEFLVKFFFT